MAACLVAGHQKSGEGEEGTKPISLSKENFPALESSSGGKGEKDIQMLARSEGEEEEKKRENISLTVNKAVAGSSNNNNNYNNDNNYNKGGESGRNSSFSTTDTLIGKATYYSNKNNNSNNTSHSNGDNNNNGNHNKATQSNSTSTNSGTNNTGGGSSSQSTAVKMSFAGVAAQTPMYTMSLEDMKRKMEEQEKYTRIEEGIATILPPAEELEATEKMTVVYRCVSTKSRRLEVATNIQIERALRTQWKHVVYVSRAKQYGVIEVLFETEDLARQHSVQPVTSEEFVMFPTYRGKKTTTIRIKNIPPRMDLWRIALCVAPDAENSVLVMKRSEVDQFSGINLEILLQATPEALEKIPHHIALPKGRALNVMVEGRKPRCHTCGALDHLIAFCPKRQASTKEWRRAPPPLLPTPSPEAATKLVSRRSGDAAATTTMAQQPRAAETKKTEAAPAVMTTVAEEAKATNRTTQGKPQSSNPPPASPIPPLLTGTYIDKTTHPHTPLLTPETVTADTATTSSEEGQHENPKRRKRIIHETTPPQKIMDALTQAPNTSTTTTTTTNTSTPPPPPTKEITPTKIKKKTHKLENRRSTRLTAAPVNKHRHPLPPTKHTNKQKKKPPVQLHADKKPQQKADGLHSRNGGHQPSGGDRYSDGSGFQEGRNPNKTPGGSM